MSVLSFSFDWDHIVTVTQQSGNTIAYSNTNNTVTGQ